jgi:putative Mg2+ transporter-C (MgtC) family protein
VDSPVFGLPTEVEWVALYRLTLATLAGAAIGWNRHRAGKPAGIGTHALVALGAALFAVVPVAAGPQYVDALARTIQGVAVGVGFLGAGEIFRDESSNKVTGLTSAAALWVTAALGITIASGSLFGSLTAAALVLAVLVLAPRLEQTLGTSRKK